MVRKTSLAHERECHPYLQGPTVRCKDRDASICPGGVLFPGRWPDGKTKVRHHNEIGKRIANLLLTRILDVLVGFEQVTDVDGLPPPELPVDSPVERQFQRPPIKRPAWLAGW